MKIRQGKGDVIGEMGSAGTKEPRLPQTTYLYTYLPIINTNSTYVKKMAGLTYLSL